VYIEHTLTSPTAARDSCLARLPPWLFALTSTVIYCMRTHQKLQLVDVKHRCRMHHPTCGPGAAPRPEMVHRLLSSLLLPPLVH